MKYFHAFLDDCESAVGTVILIDVLRAFSNAAYAFSAGAEKILLVSSVEEALALKLREPNLLITGEVGGLPPDGSILETRPPRPNHSILQDASLFSAPGLGRRGLCGASLRRGCSPAVSSLRARP
jgi:2-phosphosulfolactate phosphatase